MAATIKGNARSSTSVQRVSEGAEVFLRMLRDGSLVGANWKQAAIFQGLGYMVNVGSLTTPVGNGTIIDTDMPQFCLTIPSGTSIMPHYIEVSVLMPLLSADSEEVEILVAVDQDTASAGSTSSTAETIYNMNTLKGGGSACTAISIVTANITTSPVLDLELMHKIQKGDVQGTAATIWWCELYGLYAPEAVPIINGPATLLGYWGGTVATTGFGVFQWLEFPTSFSSI